MLSIKTVILFLIFSILIFYYSAFSQPSVDSIRKVLKSNVHDTIKITYMYQLAWQLFKHNPDTVEKICVNALNLSEKIHYIEGISNGYGWLGYIYKKQGNSKLALDNALKALNFEIKRGNKSGKGTSLGNIGWIYSDLGQISKALDYYKESMKTYEEIKDSGGIASINLNIGEIYSNLNEKKKAMEYYQKGMNISQKIKDTSRIAKFYNNIAGILDDWGKIDEALDLYLKSLKIREKLNDKFGMSVNLNNIGYIYGKKGDLTKKLEYQKQALIISRSINDKQNTAYYLANIGDLLNKTGKINEALKYADEAWRVSNELGFPRNIESASSLYAEIYKKKNDWKNAFKYKEIEMRMKDSIKNDDNIKNAAKLEERFKFETQFIKDSIEHSKQIAIKDLNYEREVEISKKQRLLIYSFIIGFIIVIIFSVLLYRQYTAKRKANKILAVQNIEIKQQNEEITAQRDEIEAQRDKLNEQNVLLEEQKQEITDSIYYARRIQQAVLTDLEHIFYIGNLYSVFGKQNAEYRILITDYFILFKPKDIVSGDFYWSTRIGEILIFTVADCTGHGVPGAFMSMLGISFLNEIVRKKEVTKASDVLNELRTSVIDALKQKGDSGEQKDGMDIALCAINMNTLEMQFAGANNPVYIVSSRQSAVISQLPPAAASCQLHELKGDKQPIGIHSNMQLFTNQIYQLQKEDIVYLMSDGYEDQFGGHQRKKFLAKNLKNLLLTNCKKLMADQKQILESTITEWIGNGEQIDDITVLGIKI